jgi:sterol desaturase/sphingolipid hydroxylase (fatty acid hydroxylase superfamily)
MRWVVISLLIIGFLSALISLILRPNKVLGFVALGACIVATLLGNSLPVDTASNASFWALGLDWFVLNMIFTGLLFIPLERLFPRHAGQALFRAEWREDLFYYLVSSLLVQIITFLTFSPWRAIVAHTQWAGLRAWVAGQPVWLQLIEVMLLTDLVQYWLHRAFHRIPLLWKFHAVHHSAQTMDWMASARMHFLEVLLLRGCTAIPMYSLGYSPTVLNIYLLLVYLQSSFVHANVGWNLEWLGRVLVTPRFHHWHHGIEKEAIDVNFSIHFPLLDKLFGTLHWPKDRWPSGYGIGGHPVPSGYWKQFLYPFLKRKKKPVAAPVKAPTDQG